MRFLAGRQRWVVVAMLFLLSAINYLDRQSLSVLAPTLREKLHFSVEQYSYIVTIFLVAYTIGFAVCGRILDRVGARAGIAVAIAFWSVSACLHSVAHSWQHLAGFRFLLGLGESFNAPGGAKVVREWVPKKERGLCMAVFSTGNIAGAIVAPPLVSFLALRYDWRLAFVITGAVGFAWLALWLTLFRSPEQHPSLTEEERKLILGDRPAAPGPAAGFWEVLRHPLTLAFVAARFLTDSLPYFFSFWLPEYLRRSHNFGLAEIGMLAWIPYLAADLGGLSGGALSDFLVRRGWQTQSARKRVLLLAACLTPVAAVAVRVDSALVSLACIGLVLAAHSAWVTNLLTLMTESMPARLSGQVVGWSGVGGSVGGILSSLATGRVVGAYGYVPIFTTLAFVHITAFAVVHFLSGDNRAGIHRVSEGD
jgi:MFS transporter, ACS family, hexuronate transporter